MELLIQGCLTSLALEFEMALALFATRRRQVWPMERALVVRPPGAIRGVVGGGFSLTRKKAASL